MFVFNLASLREEIRQLIEFGRSSTYTSWGRTTCPNIGTELVYEEYAGVDHYGHPDGAVNYPKIQTGPL